MNEIYELIKVEMQMLTSEGILQSKACKCLTLGKV